MRASVSRIYEEPGPPEKLQDARLEMAYDSYVSYVIAMLSTVRVRRKKRVHFLRPTRF